MFKKMNKSADTLVNKDSVTVNHSPEKSSLNPEEQMSNTVIAREVCFEGNLRAVGQVYIYGEVQGNIIANEGVVKVMRSGLVNGNITSHELIINGTVKGECKSESIDIGEHANINGALDYIALSVKKGAVFVGSMETSRKPDASSNIIGLTAAAAEIHREAAVLPEKPEMPQGKKRL